MSKILVVDDDVDLTQVVKTKLAADGHDVIGINTGDGAFELAKKSKPDIALLDVMLPGITGYQICRRFRKDPELYSMGVLLLTALGEEPEVLHGLEQGADDYLSKPFRLEALSEKVTSLQKLLDSVKQRSPISNLPGTEAVKRELNHRLARDTQIAVCYIDVLGFKAYCASRGKDSQVPLVQSIAKLIHGLIRNVGFYETYLAHLGGAHFAVVLSIEDYERFCSNLMDAFDQQTHQIYTQEEIEKGCILTKNKNGLLAEYPLMALSIGVSHNKHRKFKSANKVFEVLTQVRQL
ncbi:MAG: response regulator, partial [Candidatus Hydrogenedentes bacterium]|nr:response regulator [Candidatus Hydrogenedentota bacterium]